MFYGCIVLLALVVAQAEVEKCQTEDCSSVPFPLLNNLRAPLVAELDVSGINTELKNYIDRTIDKGMKTFLSELRNTTDDSIKKMKSSIAERVSMEVSNSLNNVNERLTKLRLDLDKEARRVKSGTSYTQWGRTSCTSNTSTQVYSGFVGGSSYTAGGAPNKLCLPNEPQWGLYDSKDSQSMPYIGATEFDNWDIDIKNTLFDKQYSHYLVQCAVCHTSAASVITMIPGRTECFGDWKVEYSGYIFAGYPSHKAASEYICIDGNPDFLKKGSSWADKSILYAVHAKCNGATPCPPYVAGREMACVVCSK